MIAHKVIKLSFLLGVYVLCVLILFSFGMLFWTYRTASQAIDQELRSSFEQRHRIAETVLDRQLEGIERTLQDIRENEQIVSALAQERQSEAEQVLYDFLDTLPENQLDILLVSLSNDAVWIDASSPFFAVSPIFPAILALRLELLSSGHIQRFSEDETDVTLMLRAFPIIFARSGKVLGTLFGGIVLNENFSMVETIRRKTRSQGVAFFVQGKMLASTHAEESPITMALFEARQQEEEKDVYAHNNILANYRILRLLNKETPVEAGIAITNQSVRELQYSYLQKGIFLLVFALLFLLFTVLMIRWLTFPALDKLLKYANNVASGHLQTTYQPGTIMEFNQLGQALENMVAELRETQDQFATFMNNLPLAAFIKDEHSVVQYVNHYLKDVFDAETWLLKDIYETFPKEVAQQLKMHDQQGLQAPVVYEERLCDAHGIPHIYETRKFPIRREGKPPLLGGIAVDITERKHTEEELSRTKNYVKNIIDSMPSMLVSIDADETIMQWNKKAESIAGVSWEQAKGRKITHIFPGLKPWAGNISRALQQKMPVIEEKQSLFLEEELRYMDMVFYPLLADGNDGVVIRIDDVTARVRFEEMMIQTEKMMSLGSLAAGMAHEINNPLGIILQGIQNTLRRLTPANSQNQVIARQFEISLERMQTYLEQRNIFRYLEGIQEATLRASKIVMNMLSFSRHSTSEKTLTDLNALLDQTLDLAAQDYDLKKKYDFKHIQILRDYDLTLPQVPCIVTELEQVFLNLLRNSAQAFAETQNRSPRPRPQIRLCTRREDTHVIILVQDNGPGMDEGTRKRIFEPFFTNKPVGEGTGLGLSVSYFIITDNHQGTITAESKQGEGAMFTITLPLRL